MKIAKVVTMDGSVVDVEYNSIEENYTTIKFYKTEKDYVAFSKFYVVSWIIDETEEVEE